MLVFGSGILFALLFRLAFFEETGNDFSWSARRGFDRVNCGDDGLFFVSMLLSFAQSHLRLRPFMFLKHHWNAFAVRLNDQNFGFTFRARWRLLSVIRFHTLSIFGDILLQGPRR